MRAISQIPVKFLFQSFFDGANALLLQPPNDLIVPSTKKLAQGVGYAVGVASYSQTPVAFRFYGSDRDSGVVFCRPGQIIRPGKFEAFDYGLPFGWLGGGLSVIYVAHTPETNIDVGTSRPEIIFHRARFTIQASANPLPALVNNWPLQFPWTQARRDDAGAISDQRGTPTIRVEPTRALLVLRDAITVPKSVGIVFRGTREFGEASNGVVVTNSDTFVEVAFQPSSDPLLAQNPMSTIPEDYLRLCCDDGGITITDLGDASLTGNSIDIVRFGRI